MRKAYPTIFIMVKTGLSYLCLWSGLSHRHLSQARIVWLPVTLSLSLTSTLVPIGR